MNPLSGNPDHTSPVIDYAHASTPARGLRLSEWIALAFGVVQIPWAFYWLFAILETHNGQPVRLLADSPGYVLALACTFASLCSGFYCLWQRRPLRGKIVGTATIFVSLCVMVVIVLAWFQDVYLNRNGSYGWF